MFKLFRKDRTKKLQVQKDLRKMEQQNPELLVSGIIDTTKTMGKLTDYRRM